MNLSKKQKIFIGSYKNKGLKMLVDEQEIIAKFERRIIFLNEKIKKLENKIKELEKMNMDLCNSYIELATNKAV